MLLLKTYLRCYLIVSCCNGTAQQNYMYIQTSSHMQSYSIRASRRISHKQTNETKYFTSPSEFESRPLSLGLYLVISYSLWVGKRERQETGREGDREGWVRVVLHSSACSGIMCWYEQYVAICPSGFQCSFKE